MVNAQKALQSARKSVEQMYTGTCDVWSYEQYTKDNGATGNKEVKLFEQQPCRLSYSSNTSAEPSSTLSDVRQDITLFIAPELAIKPGSKIIVTQAGKTAEYKSSGDPKMYESHQEVALEIAKEWA